MKPIEVTSLIGKPLTLPNGRKIGLITDAKIDTTGIHVAARVTDEDVQRLVRERSGYSVGGYE